MPDLPTQDTWLGFDFGTQKIGVAVGQAVTGTASPLLELRAKEGQPDWQQVAALIDTWQPQALIVGVPVLMDGSEFELTQRARKFGQRLHGRFGLPWHAADERLSSFEARERAGRRRAGTLVDSLAAQVILESWMAQQAERPSS